MRLRSGWVGRPLVVLLPSKSKLVRFGDCSGELVYGTAMVDSTRDSSSTSGRISICMNVGIDGALLDPEKEKWLKMEDQK